MRTITLNILLALTALFTFSACGDECPTCETVPDNGDGLTPGQGSIRVYYSMYGEEMGTKAAAGTQLDLLELFVFDSDGILVHMAEEFQPVIDGRFYIPLALDNGTYTLVTWTNLNETFGLIDDQAVIGTSTIDEIEVKLRIAEESIVSDDIVPFHYSTYEAVIEDQQTHYRFVKILKPQTYLINISTVGLNDVDNDYTFTISSNHASKSFYGKPNLTEDIIYVRDCDKDEDNEIYASIRLLDLDEDLTRSVFSIYDKYDGVVLYETDLVTLILSLRNQGVEVDFDKIFEYDIVLYFSGGKMRIYINGWQVHEDDYVLGG